MAIRTICNPMNLPCQYRYFANSREGVDPNELHIHYTGYGQCELTVGCLNAGVKYYLTVDSFNEGGITRGTRIMEIEA